MPQGLKKFIEKLQNAEERTKKRYLLLFSGIAMAVVVVLWVYYMKATIALETSGGQALKNFFSAIGHWFKDLFLKIKTGRVIIIER